MEKKASHDNNKLSFSEIEESEKYGSGKLYRIGSVEVEIYENMPENRPSLARIRAPGVSMALSYVSEIRTNNGGDVLIDFGREGQKVFASLSISQFGDIAFIYSPPPPPMGISETGIKRKIGDNVYAQSTIDIPGTAEGVRVQIRGTVDAPPRPVAPNLRNSPLVFFLIEENPKEPEKPVYHEVWAVKAPRLELKNAKLTKGTVIEAVLYRHTIATQLMGGTSEVVTRHNLAKIISVQKPGRGQKSSLI